MSMLDSTFDLLLKSFKVRSKELPADEALRFAGELKRFFAVELIYKKQPVRLIVATSNVPREFLGADNAKKLLDQTSDALGVGGGTTSPAIENRGSEEGTGAKPGSLSQ